MKDDVLGYILVFAILLRCVSYIPFIVEIQKYEYTLNIPYATLFLELLSYVIFIVVASMKRFYVQVACLLCYIILVVYMLTLKIKYDKYHRPVNVRR